MITSILIVMLAVAVIIMPFVGREDESRWELVDPTPEDHGEMEPAVERRQDERAPIVVFYSQDAKELT